MSKGNEIAILGVGMHPWGKWGKNFVEYGVHAGRAVAFGVFDERSGTEEVVVVAESDLSDEEKQFKLADEVRKYVTTNSAVALRVVRIVPSKWIIKTSSGKPARTANKEKYLEEFDA